jgi:hypothetical protein
VKICIKLLGGTEWAADEFSFSVATFTEQDASDAKGTIYHFTVHHPWVLIKPDSSESAVTACQKGCRKHVSC